MELHGPNQNSPVGNKQGSNDDELRLVAYGHVVTSWHGIRFRISGSLRSRPYRRHFADDIFHCIFENENEWISLRISLKFVQVSNLMIVYSSVYLDIKKTSKLLVIGLYAGNSPGTGEFPAQRASNAENVSIWWRHHENYLSFRILQLPPRWIWDWIKISSHNILGMWLLIHAGIIKGGPMQDCPITMMCCV